MIDERQQRREDAEPPQLRHRHILQRHAHGHLGVGGFGCGVRRCRRRSRGACHSARVAGGGPACEIHVSRVGDADVKLIHLAIVPQLKGFELRVQPVLVARLQVPRERAGLVRRQQHAQLRPFPHQDAPLRIANPRL